MTTPSKANLERAGSWCEQYRRAVDLADAGEAHLASCRRCRAIATLLDEAERRGAEAMRERAIKAVNDEEYSRVFCGTGREADWTRFLCTNLLHRISALPLPGEEVDGG